MIELVVVTMTLATLILVAVLCFRTLQTMAVTFDRAHERWVASSDRLMDRLMANDLNHYKLWQHTDEAEEGGQTFPDRPEASPRDPDEPVPWGTMSAMRTRMRTVGDDLLEEDEESDDERRQRQHAEYLKRSQPKQHGAQT